MSEPRNSKKTILIISLVNLVIALGLVFFLAFPFYRKVYLQKDELEAQRLAFSAAKDDMFQSGKYQELSQTINSNKLLLDEMLFNGDSMIKFIERLEKTAKDTGNKIAIQEYKPPKGKKAAPVKEAEETIDPKKDPAASPDKAGPKKEAAPAGNYFLLTLEGNYQQSLAFLYQLENLNYLFMVDSLEIKSKEVVAKPGQEAAPKDLVETRVIISITQQKQ